MDGFRYTYSKLSESLGILATHQGTLRERIVYAFAPFITIAPQSFPDELGQRFDDLMRWATSFLSNHADCLATIDLFVVPTATFRRLYTFMPP